MKKEQRAFGIFTFILGAIALWDGILSAIGAPVPFWLLATAAPKLILAVVWDFWLAVVLLKTEDDETETENTVESYDFVSNGNEPRKIPNNNFNLSQKI